MANRCQLGTAALTLGFVVAAGETPAYAFFPPVAIPNEPVTVLPPTPSPIILNPIAVPTVPATPHVIPPSVVIPPVPPPPTVPPTVPVDPIDHCPCVPGKPQEVPEPTTILSGVIGLGAIGAWKRFRARRPS